MKQFMFFKKKYCSFIKLEMSAFLKLLIPKKNLVSSHQTDPHFFPQTLESFLMIYNKICAHAARNSEKNE